MPFTLKFRAKRRSLLHRSSELLCIDRRPEIYVRFGGGVGRGKPEGGKERSVGGSALGK